MGRTVRTALVAAAAAIVLAVAPAGALAQLPNQVTGLTAVQKDGFTTLRWTPVAGATDYQIERTPVNASGVPTGTGVVVGLWRPNRQINQGSPAFADAGYVPGATLQWRVRARFGTTTQPYSDPVWAATNLPFAGGGLLTQFEQSSGSQWTTDVNEYAYTAALDVASDRVRVVEIGRTLQNRPINMFIVGYPNPPATAAEIAAGSSALVNCNVHGNEPSSREACMILARELAFSEDARTIDILRSTTVLIVPTINGDGRAANARGNQTGQDLNRDYSLIRQPETFGFVRMLRDYRPQAAFDGHEFGNDTAGDLPTLPPRHQNVAQSIFDESQTMITGWMYGNGSTDGWWFCPYGCAGGGSVGLSEETILRNAMGLKNTIGSLLEARSAGGATRPAEGATNSAPNRLRKTYSALYTYQQFLDYYHARRAEIGQAVADSVAFQNSNTGRIVFRGSRPIPGFPAPHPGESPPPVDAPAANAILNTPPCGYRLTEAQYNGPRTDSPSGFPTTVAQRIEAHGWAVEARPAGYIVRMAQRERGLIPLLLDAQAAEEWVSGQRLSECPYVAAAPASLAAGVTEETDETLTLTVGNQALEPNQPLTWTITEAASSCSAPSDLDWLSVDVSSGTTASSSSTSVAVTFSAAGLTAPDTRSGVLCLASNDPGEPLVVVPVSLQVEYPFDGFLATFANPPVLNASDSRNVQTMWFRLGGDRGLGVLAAGSPVSRQIDCATAAPIGPLEPAETPSWDSLAFQAHTGRYTYPWKPAKGNAYAGTCRELLVTLDDQSVHAAWFHFVK